MKYIYPKAEDVGIVIPPNLIKQRFDDGFLHALKGRQITKTEHLKLSFREGYRAGKFYLRDLRRAQGIYTFPVEGRVSIKAYM